MRDMPWHVPLKDDRAVDSKFGFKEVHKPKKDDENVSNCIIQMCDLLLLKKKTSSCGQI